MATSRAVLLSRTPFRESDLVVQLFAEEFGRISALARGARRSQKRFGGTLEPFHGLRVELSLPQRGELFGLTSSQLERPRLGLSEDLARMRAAGEALRWIRTAATEHGADKPLFEELHRFLDRLDGELQTPTALVAAEFGLRLLALLGWELELSACVRCGQPCPPNKSATVSVSQGGLLCHPCGGAALMISGPQRHRFTAAARGGKAILEAGDEDLAQRLVEKALEVHAQLRGEKRGN